MVEFMQGDNDWFVDTIYLDQDWVDAEVQIYELMKKLTQTTRTRLMPDAGLPRFEVLTP